ncbi:transcription initiation factor TFIID subunit 5-like [Teleopsis dalmanni]|uniref:transcription initiation factor TFIID subunit 5-like n=1 Tax=Teleopsis dalmanni TaxID=139649 RepID=UPI0018CE8AF0|nr:transcription initiation factor TFIID subunit 5-like [Teleopsis dalmanni]
MRTTAFTELLAYAPLISHVPPTLADYMKSVKDDQFHRYQTRKLLNQNAIPDIRMFIVECNAGMVSCASYSQDATMLGVAVQHRIFVLVDVEKFIDEQQSNMTFIRQQLNIENRSKAVLDGHTGIVRNLEFAPFNNVLVSSADDLTIRVWSMELFTCLRVYNGHSSAVSRVCFPSHYKFIASCSYDKTVHIWVEGQNVMHILENDQLEVYDIDVHPNNNYVASAASNGTVIIWNVIYGNKMRIFKGHQAGAVRVKFSACGRYLVSSGKDRTTLIWDIQDTSIVGILRLHSTDITSIIITEDNAQLVLISNTEFISFWRISKMISDYRNDKAPMYSQEYNFAEKKKYWQDWQTKYLVHLISLDKHNVLGATVTHGNEFYVACVPKV